MCEIRLTKLSCAAQQVGIAHFYAVTEIKGLSCRLWWMREWRNLLTSTHVCYRSVIWAVASGASLKFGVQSASATNWFSRVNGAQDNVIRLYDSCDQQPANLLMAPIWNPQKTVPDSTTRECVNMAVIHGNTVWWELTQWGPCTTQEIGHATWRPLLGLLSWCPCFMQRHCNSFEDRAPVDFIYGCPIFKWVAAT